MGRCSNHILLFMVGLLLTGCFVDTQAQILEPARSLAFDRGLVDSNEPFSSTGNPALLSWRDQFRFYFGIPGTFPDAYHVELSYPLSVSTGLGISWFSSRNESMETVRENIFQIENKTQKLMLNIGHHLRVPVGHQIEFSYGLNNFYPVHVTDPLIQPFTNEHRLALSYRVGLYYALSKKISVGLLTVPLFSLNHIIYVDSEKPSETETRFWTETDSRTKWPMFGMKWEPSSRLGLAFSSRSKRGEDDCQLAAEYRVRPFVFTGALRKRDREGKAGIILGLGGYFKGFDLFSAYDPEEKELKLAVSFAPERAKKLIEVRDFVPVSRPLYPYRLKYGKPANLAKAVMENVTDQPVEVSIKLLGHDLPDIHKNLIMKPKSFASVDIPVPARLSGLKAGFYQYNVEVLAYHRGRQKQAYSFRFEMKDSHDWSGLAEDLVYFVEPEESRVFTKSRRIISRSRSSLKTKDAVCVAEFFYRFIKDSITYIPDPKPLHVRGDRGQYATEVLASRSGDCEDLSILMISFLQSVGVDGAFVEYVVPESNEGHVFVLFDSQKTGAELVAENKNLQNYVVRYVNARESKYYIPLELTKRELDFCEAWRCGLDQYRKIGIEQNGLVEGWFKIIDAQ